MPKHLWKPGQSGNPKGKPKGTLDRRILWRDSRVSPHKEALVEKAIEVALSGSVPMLTFFLDKVLPRRPMQDGIDIGIKDSSIAKQGKRIVQLLSEGHITSDEAQGFMQTLLSQGKIIESTEILERIKNLEDMGRKTNETNISDSGESDNSDQ